MIEIVKVLMNYGMDFEYENRGSNGEQIKCFQLGAEVANQDGKIYYSISSPPENIIESNRAYKLVAQLVEEECIAETT